MFNTQPQVNQCALSFLPCLAHIHNLSFLTKPISAITNFKVEPHRTALQN